MINVDRKVIGGAAFPVYIKEESTAATPVWIVGGDITTVNAPPDDDKALYVSKSGNNINNGQSSSFPKLTITSAIIKANELIAAGNPRVVIHITDSGAYTENLTLNSGINIEASGATLIGTLILPSDCYAKFNIHYPSANSQNMVDKAGNSGFGTYQVNLIEGRGTLGTTTGTTLFRNTTEGSDLIAHFGVAHVPTNGIGISDHLIGEGSISLIGSRLYLSGNSATAILSSSGLSTVSGFIDSIEDFGSPVTTTAIFTHVSGSQIKLTTNRINAITAYNIDQGSLYLNCRDVNGVRIGAPKFLPVSEFFNVTSTAINYLVTVVDEIISATTSGITVTLPTAIGYRGKQFVVDNNSLGDIFITGSETIQGLATAILPTNSSVTIYSNNVNWRLI